MYQDLYDKAKKIIKKDTCMKFYDESRPLYLETDASGVGLGDGLLQVRESMICGCDEIPDDATLCPIAFTGKGLSNAEWCYSNVESEGLGTLHALEKFIHYNFAKEVCAITDHKLLEAIISKNVAMLSQCLQCILLCIHKYRLCISYRSDLDLYIVDWLS